MQLPECDGPMRGWLRGRSSLARVENRVFFAVPEQDEPELPFIVFYRVGGIPDSHGADNPDYIIEAWARTKYDASTLAKDIATEILVAMDERPVVIDGVKVESSGVNFGPLPSAGAGPGKKRYRVDASMRMRQS